MHSITWNSQMNVFFSLNQIRLIYLKKICDCNIQNVHETFQVIFQKHILLTIITLEMYKKI